MSWQNEFTIENRIKEKDRKYSELYETYTDAVNECEEMGKDNIEKKSEIYDLKGVIEGQRKMINERNQEIEDLKKQIENIKILQTETNKYDAEMKGMQL